MTSFKNYTNGDYTYLETPYLTDEDYNNIESELDFRNLEFKEGNTMDKYLKAVRYFKERGILQQEYEMDNERLAVYDDGIQHLDEYQEHCVKANDLIPRVSFPHEEPWCNGPPSFAYYTEVDLPVHRLPYNITTDEEFKNSPNVIYVPSQGAANSSIINMFVAQIVGRDGDWLKKITEECNVHYIWFNKNPMNNAIPPAWGAFQLWGHPVNLNKAKTLLNRQIHYILNKIHKHTPAVPE